MPPQTRNTSEKTSTTTTSNNPNSIELEHQPNSSNDDDSIGDQLSWRLDPKVSFSDWTIIVTPVDADTNKKTSSSVEYHVHRSMIAVGPRRSKYFSSIMRSPSALSEHIDSTSKISLDPNAADVFPIMLDYMYSAHNVPLDIITPQAPPLRFLASYFDVRPLLHDVNNFIRKDLSCTTAPIYLAEGDVYHDENLIDLAIRVIAENVEGIYIGFLAALPPHLFHRVVKSPKLRCKSSWLSKIVSEFCRTQEELIDGEMLLELTGEDMMPEIIEEEAMFLLKLSADLGIDEDGEGSLKRRCIQTCAALWKENLARPLKLSMTDHSGGGGGRERRKSIEYVERRSSSPVTVGERSVSSLPPQTSPSGRKKTSSRSSPPPPQVSASKQIAAYKNLPPSLQVELLESALCCALEDVDIANQSKENEINRLYTERNAKTNMRMGDRQKSSRF